MMETLTSAVTGVHPGRRGVTTAADVRGVAECFFFWDYDTQWGADRSRGGGGKARWGMLDFENTERLLELHARFGVTACFAVVGAAATPGERPYHDPEQIRRIHAAGHEIASHSHQHEWLPGLGSSALRETLRASKDSLEQCIGAPVLSFVPPYNQPFDFATGWSYSLSERREAGRERTDVFRLCEALAATGYQFCRVAYQSLAERLIERLRGRRVARPSAVRRIAGIQCLRLTAASGFAVEAEALLGRCVAKPSKAVFYGHPHSLTLGDSQDEKWLQPFLEKVTRLRTAGRLAVRLPRELIAFTP